MKASPQDKGREKKQKSCHINKRMYGMYIHERRNMMEAYYKKSFLAWNRLFLVEITFFHETQYVIFFVDIVANT